MTLIAFASKLVIKSNTDSIKADLACLKDMLKLAKNLVNESSVGEFVANIETQMKYLKAKRKELVKNFEKGAKMLYKNEEGDVYKCEVVFETEEYTEILFWIPYLEAISLKRIHDKSQIL